MPSRTRARGSRKIYINFTPSVERRSTAYPSVVGNVRRNSIACVRASSRDRVCTSTYTSLSYDLFDTYISTYIQSHAHIRARARPARLSSRCKNLNVPLRSRHSRASSLSPSTAHAGSNRRHTRVKHSRDLTVATPRAYDRVVVAISTLAIV
jgi:hypothetical protein